MKLVYALLFLALLVQPHVITSHVFFLPRPYVQSLLTFLLLGLAYLTYRLHGWEVARREAAHARVVRQLNVSTDKLIAAFEYIGKVNRRLPLLNNVTTDLLARAAPSKNGRKEVLQRLLATVVVSIMRVEWGCLRFVELARQRTVKEFWHPAGSSMWMRARVSNRLLQTRGRSTASGGIGKLHVIATSDRQSPIQCFLVLPDGQPHLDDERLVAQAIVDQAQLFYKFLY